MKTPLDSFATRNEQVRQDRPTRLWFTIGKTAIVVLAVLLAASERSSLSAQQAQPDPRSLPLVTACRDLGFDFASPTMDIGAGQQAIQLPARSNRIEINTAPLTLDQGNTEYVLMADVTAPLTAFTLKGSNSTLNLNGHTVTYGTVNSIDGNSHGVFVDWLATGWIANGNIVQGGGVCSGNASGLGCNPIFLGGQAEVIGGLSIAYHTPDTTGILAPNRTVEIHHNTLTDSGTVVTYAGTGVPSIQNGGTGGSIIHHNLILGARHRGIQLGNNSTASYNEIHVNAYQSNAYGVMVWEIENFSIHHNKIYGSGVHPMGIGGLTNSRQGRIYSNSVEVENSRTVAGTTSGSTAFRITTYAGGTADEIEAMCNYFVTRGGNTHPELINERSWGRTLWIGGLAQGDSARLHHNYVEALATDPNTYHSAIAVISEGHNDGLVLEHNIVVANHTMVALADGYGGSGLGYPRFIRNRFIRQDSYPSYRTITDRVYNYFNITGLFLDNTYENGAEISAATVNLLYFCGNNKKTDVGLGSLVSNQPEVYSYYTNDPARVAQGTASEPFGSCGYLVSGPFPTPSCREIVGPVTGRTYYLAPNGNDANAGTILSPWRTLARADDTLRSGDLLLVRGGEYTELRDQFRTPAPNITIRNYPCEVPVFRTVGADFFGSVFIMSIDKDDVTVRGLEFRPTEALQSDVGIFVTGHRAKLLDLTVIGPKLPTGVYTFKQQVVRVHGNDVEIANSHLSGTGDTTSPIGANGNTIVVFGNYANIHDNHLERGVHDVIRIDGTGSVVRDNIMTHSIGYGVLFQPGSRRNLAERNWITGNDEELDYVKSPLAMNGSENVMRFNVGWAGEKLGGGQREGSNSRFYNNTLYGNGTGGFNPWCSDAYDCRNNIYINNVIAGNMRQLNLCDQGRAEVQVGSDFHDPSFNNQFRDNYIVSYDRTTGSFVNDSQCSVSAFIGAGTFDRYGRVSEFERDYPMTWSDNISAPCDLRFIDPDNGDLRIQDGSCLADAGTPLTTAREAGSGTSLPVTDAIYFWPGDIVQIGTNARAKVTAIDTTNHVLTLETAATWAANVPVTLPYQGTSPAIGAYDVGGQPPVVCTPDWQCGEWSVCTDGEQTRTCVDQNACGQTPPTDLTTRVCDVTPPAAVTDLRAN